jgi:hypothetical protein
MSTEHQIQLNGKTATVNPIPLYRLGEVIQTLTTVISEANIDETTSNAQAVSNFVKLVASDVEKYASIIQNLANNDDITTEDVKNSKPHELLDLVDTLLVVNEWEKIRERFLGIQSKIQSENRA